MQPDKCDCCLSVSSLNSEGCGKVVFRTEKGSSPSLLGNRGLTRGVRLIDPRLCVQNTVDVSLKHLLLKTGSPPFPPLHLCPRKTEHYSQEPRRTHRLQLHHLTLRIHIFTIVITWYILLIILIIADLDLREAGLNNARTIQHKHAVDGGLLWG